MKVLSIGSHDVPSIPCCNASYPTSWLSGSIRAESVSENPLRAGQERPHRRGERASVQMPCRGQSARRGVQVSGENAGDASTGELLAPLANPRCWRSMRGRSLSSRRCRVQGMPRKIEWLLDANEEIPLPYCLATTPPSLRARFYGAREIPLRFAVEEMPLRGQLSLPRLRYLREAEAFIRYLPRERKRSIDFTLKNHRFPESVVPQAKAGYWPKSWGNVREELHAGYHRISRDRERLFRAFSAGTEASFYRAAPAADNARRRTRAGQKEN